MWGWFYHVRSRHAPVNVILKLLDLISVWDQIKYNVLLMIYKMKYNILAGYLRKKKDYTRVKVYIIGPKTIINLL